MSGKKKWVTAVLVTTILLSALGCGDVTLQVQEFGTSVTVVNMIPVDRSDEENQDSEPNIAVNPANPLEIAGSAFTPNPMRDTTDDDLASFAEGVVGIPVDDFPPSEPGEPIDAPIYISTDGGLTWSLNDVSVSGANRTTGRLFDITVRFGGMSNILYAAYLRGDQGFGDYLCPYPPEEEEDLVFLKDCSPSQGPLYNIGRSLDIEDTGVMDIIWEREFIDQPYIQVETVRDNYGRSEDEDRIFVGFNDFSSNVFIFPGLLDASGRTASVDHSAVSTTADIPVLFKQSIIESHSTAGQNAPAVRVAVHQDGTVYGIFYRYTSLTGDFDPYGSITAAVIVVRDDEWGSGDSPFTHLLNPADDSPGIVVIPIAKIPYSRVGLPDFGQERLVSSDISIAVDPRDSDIVYIAWADSPIGASEIEYTLHLRRSTNRGETWYPSDLLTVANAKNPALAINTQGKVGFLYQSVTHTGDTLRWVTHFRRSMDGLTWDDMILADVPAETPEWDFLPYIGDYVHVMAVNNDFYGVFSANNTPNLAHFPQGVIYQRFANFEDHTLLSHPINGREVMISIDPFFFKVDEFDFQQYAPIK